MGINILSLFDGMSCGQIALEKVGVKVDLIVTDPSYKVTSRGNSGNSGGKTLIKGFNFSKK